MSKKRRVNYFRGFFEAIILLIFVKPMFNLNPITGIVYIIALIGAFWKKLIFRKKGIAWMIIFGTLLSYIVGKFLPLLIGSYLAGDIISTIIIAILLFLIWKKGRKLRRGKRK